MGFFTLSCNASKRRKRRSVKRKPVKSKRKRKPVKSKRKRKPVKSKRKRKPVKRKSKRKSVKRKRKFGASPNLNRVMGNYGPALMNTFQEYTGAGTDQRMNHLNGIPVNLRDNFYT